ncbi:Plasmodium vivax Vir protein, putative [Plasmodium ovale]|uniref:Plasmodium vivax Vir protein, putative n=1 Tax=Plasmodium ovale TaxID=36330 RepID=A0A1C3KG72_PLAOA|nr:Plasmodium vivax Vir protein, putative [Plasmodium ovale]
MLLRIISNETLNIKALNDGNSKYDVSLILNYWIYDELAGIYYSNKFEEISISFSSFQHLWGRFTYNPINESYHQKCKPDLSIINHNNWNKRKELYYYYVDYQTFYGIASTILSKYDSPEFYKNYEYYNPNKVLHKLLCRDDMVAKTATFLSDEKPRAVQHTLRERQKSGAHAHGPGVRDIAERTHRAE